MAVDMTGILLYTVTHSFAANCNPRQHYPQDICTEDTYSKDALLSSQALYTQTAASSVTASPSQVIQPWMSTYQPCHPYTHSTPIAMAATSRAAAAAAQLHRTISSCKQQAALHLVGASHMVGALAQIKGAREWWQLQHRS